MIHCIGQLGENKGGQGHCLFFGNTDFQRSKGGFMFSEKNQNFTYSVCFVLNIFYDNMWYNCFQKCVKISSGCF